MAMALSKRPFYIRPPLNLITANAHRRRSAFVVVETVEDPQTNSSKWTTTSMKELGIHLSIPWAAARSVLNGLRKKGFEVYLVGGCGRDVIMKRTPKDFDILTTAELRELIHTLVREMEELGTRGQGKP